MIQDIAPHRYDNSFSKELPRDNDCVLIFENDSVFLHNFEDKQTLPKYKDIKLLLNKDENVIYLFSIDESRYYLVLNNGVFNKDIFSKESIQVFRELKPKYMAFAGITAFHLYNWYSENKYCGKCAKPMKHRTDERALVCEHCKTTKYPKISPAVIVGITDGDKILMTKYSRGNYKKYALIAGFMEIGETLEDTVRREVMEEVGLKVKNIRYYKNQPWAFSSSLLVGYFAELDGDNNVTIDTEELSEAVWFERKDIPKTDSDISLTSEMIEAFRNKDCIN